MTPGEFRDIAKSMKEFGISYVKMGDVTVQITSGMEQFAPGNDPHLKPEKNADLAVSEASDPIKHRVDQMASLMKLSDNELVDQLWPDKTDEIA
jgi:hypothetical protein